MHTILKWILKPRGADLEVDLETSEADLETSGWAGLAGPGSQAWLARPGWAGLAGQAWLGRHG